MTIQYLFFLNNLEKLSIELRITLISPVVQESLRENYIPIAKLMANVLRDHVP